MRETSTRPLPISEKRDWLRLIRSENIGPITFFKLLDHYGSAAAALQAIPDLAKSGGRAGKIRIAPRAEAEREMEECGRIGVHVVARGEPEYPPLLSHIEDAPPLIFALGHMHLLAKAAVAVIGARNSSVVGRRFAHDLAADLGAGGLLVVSGMARGIDAAAHDGALASGTAAVLGGGVDVVYPRENEALYESIIERGVLVSEVSCGTKPQARHFPRRNRIISGISRGVVVVEANPRSGSLITARLALEQGREVFAVPGSPLDPRAKGANKLIRDGATMAESAEDVLRVLNEQNRPLKERRTAEFSGVPRPRPNESELNSARREIIESLGPVPVTVDELLRSCQFSPAVASVILLELELAGRLERHPGNQVSLILQR
ncbi:MAG: DNA-protecting protein DprA [Rhodospirillales bacterium]|jgi:DNA processing protein|nr:DNA-protecting protein DprA [Rhodospirillales bacterium]